MNLDAAGDGDEAEHIVAVDGVAAVGQLVVDALEVLVDDEYVVAGRELGIEGGELVVERELLG